MARISVLGGTGYLGSALVAEGIRRGHQVTSVSRKEPEARLDGVSYLIGSALDPDVLARAVEGHDVVLEAVSPRGDMVGKEEGLVDQLIELTPRTGTRLGVVGGASSLLAEEGGPRLYDVTVDDIPAEVKPEIDTGMAVLETLKNAPADVDWFYVSPPQDFGAWVPAPTRASTGSARTCCCATATAGPPSPRPTSPGRSSTRSRCRSSGAAGSTRRTELRQDTSRLGSALLSLAPRVGVEPTSLILIQSQAGPAGRPTGD